MRLIRTAQTQPELFSEEEMESQYSDWQEEAEYSHKSMVEVVRKYDLPFNVIDLNGNKVMMIQNKYICEDYINYSDFEDATEWLDNLWSMQLDEYMPMEEDNYWEGVYPSSGTYQYHGTSEERLSDILANGLEPRNETRGISNRSMGAGVFTSESYEAADAYYDAVIQIDVGLMKQDGYTPETSGESPIDECRQRSAIAHLLELNDYYCEPDSSDGLAEDTVVFYGKIPPKYLTVLED